MPESFRHRRHRLPSLAAQVLVVLAVLYSARPATAQNASIGLYSDASGNTCSFTGDAPGLMTAYVVIRPDASGMTAIQFAAPVPACFGAVFVSDVAAAGALLIGGSQTGASMSLPFCASQPVNVLQINYYRSGGTTPCCAYPIVPDPALGSLEATDCTFQSIPVAGVVSHFNADASCECHGNSAPAAPINPFPQDGVASASVTPLLSWYGADVDNNLANYDVYFGTSPSPPLVASSIPVSHYILPAPLASGVQHFWRVVARDSEGFESSGPTWRFTTRTGNFAPLAPESPLPIDGEVGVSTAGTLAWSCVDLDGDMLRYDVYFGTSSDPPLVAEDVFETNYSPGTLTPVTHYYWRVVGNDGSAETSGPTWSFWSGGGNLPPDPPFLPSPPDGSINASSNPTLTWDCVDPDASGTLEYDVYFGDTSPPPLVSSSQTTRSYSPGTLSVGAEYFWRVLARDAPNSETSGPEWSFTVRAGNAPPNAPHNPTPFDGSTFATTTTNLSWDANDPDGDALTYSVYFGTSPSPPLVATGLSAPLFTPGPLSFETLYYWRVESSDGLAITSGPVWGFTTMPFQLIGDVNGDGEINLNDARCALDNALAGFCGAAVRANVDCGPEVTPRDARCIHQFVLDGSCTFCTGSAIAAPPTQSATPVLTAFNTWAVGDTLITQIFVSGVPSLQSFEFKVSMSVNVYVARAVRIGATLGWQGMLCVPPQFGIGGFPGYVGGYTLGTSDASATVGLVELHFVLKNGIEGFAQIDNYRDDLAGGNSLIIRVSDDGPLPVLISRFDAVQKEEFVELSWDFSSDEPVDTYRLYRSEGIGGPSTMIAQGDAATVRTYLDQSVRPSTSYRYELVVRTRDGEEYRSQPATITTAALSMALGQNHPNPFNPSTTIPFTVASDDSRVRLFILDAGGRIVRTLFNGAKPAGSHTVTWDGRDERGGATSSGVYFYVLDVNGERRTRKMVLLK